MSEALPPCHAACRSYDRWLCHTGDHRFRSSSRRTLQRRPGYPDPVGTGHCSIVNFASAVPIGGKAKFAIGSGLPIIMGVSFAYVPSMQAIAESYGIAAIMGAEIVGGIVAVVMGLLVKKIRVFFPAANHRNSRIYHRSFPVSDCH